MEALTGIMIGGSGIHNDYYSNRLTGGAYSFSDIQNGNLAVYPNSGALRRVSGWNGNHSTLIRDTDIAIYQISVQ